MQSTAKRLIASLWLILFGVFVTGEEISAGHVNELPHEQALIDALLVFEDELSEGKAEDSPPAIETAEELIELAEQLPDQQQPVIDSTVGGLAIGGGSDQKLAQVVTQGISGRLTEVRFPVACTVGDMVEGDLIVEIQGVAGDQPNGMVLTSETIPGGSLPSFPPSPPSFRSLAFSTPVSFLAGDRFAVVLSSAGACGVFRGPIGNPYPGGDGFFDALENRPFRPWVPFGELANARVDLPFQTLVGTEEKIVKVGFLDLVNVTLSTLKATACPVDTGIEIIGCAVVGDPEDTLCNVLALVKEFEVTNSVTHSLQLYFADLAVRVSKEALGCFLPGDKFIISKPIFGRGLSFFSVAVKELIDPPEIGTIEFTVEGIRLVSLGVDLDIKPGSDPNSINPRSKGVIPVAILTTDSFDAATVDPTTVEFGPNAAMEAHERGHIKDADGDGDLDLLLHFRTQDTGIKCGDTSAFLTGETFGGQAIEGSDSINTVGCK